MGRIRTIKPAFFESPRMAHLSYRARLTYIGTWLYVDDAGRGFDDPRLVKAAVWPQDDDVTHDDVAADLDALEQLGVIERWVDDTGRRCFRVRSFLAHQRINRPSQPRIAPSPEEQLEAASVSAQGGLTEHSSPEAEAEADADVERGSGSHEDDSEFEARVRVEAEKRIAHRRVVRGENIGPRLEQMIYDDVRRDLAALGATRAADASVHLPSAEQIRARLPTDDEVAPPPRSLTRAGRASSSSTDPTVAA